MTWTELEDLVREISSYIWDVPARAETINGVRFDCVVKKEHDYWVIAEVSKDNSLEKIRIDIAKLQTVKLYLNSQGIYVKCYFVCENKPTENVITTANGFNIEALCFKDLQAKFFDYNKYHFIRSQKKFGSAVDPKSGDKDIRKYVPVKYTERATGKQLTIDDITMNIYLKKQVILLGNYGTGKSRCVQEIFIKMLIGVPFPSLYPMAINLRDNWGLKRGSEIIRRHFEDLGLTKFADNVVKVIDKGKVPLFLDGFDEIGSQAWSDNPEKLADIKYDALAGVRDLVKDSKAGILITGREHYFNTDEEMFKCLGINPSNSLVLACADEFTNDEMLEYLSVISQVTSVPKWLPRRPLICQVLSTLDEKSIERIVQEHGGEIEFFYTFIIAICDREARIHSSLDANTIKQVLLELANISRRKPYNMGPITVSELNMAFEKVVGSPPVDESAIMLHRLPLLGRIQSETTDRQFVDEYILDGLRAESLTMIVHRESWDNYINDEWINPLKLFGIHCVARDIDLTNNETSYYRLLKLACKSRNHFLGSDILSSMLISDKGQVHFGGVKLSEGYFVTLDFSETRASDFEISDSIIEDLNISAFKPMNIVVSSCLIKTIHGISSIEGIPTWIEKPSIENYEVVTNVSRIKQADLTVQQKIFVTIIHKIFFQPGSGRKEAALLKGLGDAADKRIAKKIMSVLVDEGIVDTHPGYEGTIYVPIRRYTKRMRDIITQLKLSEDPVWKRLERI